jgi:hypothetical protein
MNQPNVRHRQAFGHDDATQRPTHFRCDDCESIGSWSERIVKNPYAPEDDPVVFICKDCSDKRKERAPFFTGKEREELDEVHRQMADEKMQRNEKAMSDEIAEKE